MLKGSQYEEANELVKIYYVFVIACYITLGT